MDNFMYNVMTNGIGGVNCGGVEGDCEIRDSINTIGTKIKLHDALIDGAYVEKAVEFGYLKIVNPFEYASSVEVDRLNYAKKKRKEWLSRNIKILKREIASFEKNGVKTPMPNHIRNPKEKEIEASVKEMKGITLLKKRKTQYSVTKLGVEKYGFLAETGMMIDVLHKEGVTPIQ